MRRVYLTSGVPEIPPGQAVQLDAAASHYLVRVLRLSAGETVALFGPSGSPRVGELVAADARGATVRMTEDGIPAQLTDAPFPVTLLQGMLRARKFDSVLQKATELGVNAIWPVVTERCVTLPQEERVEHQVARWQRICGEAVRQCLRRQVPLVRAPLQLRSALEQLPQRNNDLKLVLWERESGRTMRQTLETAAPDHCTVFVGPEGGFTDAEIGRCVDAGFVPVSVGPRIVRAETAPLIALTAIQLAWGDMR